ncbi:MAG: hypothetical protein O7H39_16320, partial [Gammaproteobacteria bacterium]|nr:hypothetical protein [Gammaproteobacteria bacterium]
MGSGFDGGVERRVLLLFAALTLLPMLTFGFFALQEIGAQTVEQAERGLRAASKDYALRLLERLEWLSARRRVTPEGKLLFMDRHAPKPSLAAVDGALVIQRSGAGETVTVRFADLFRDVSEIGGGSGRCVLINSIPVDCALPDLDSERYVSATWPLFLNSMFQSEFNLAVVSFRERAGLLGAVWLVGNLLPPTTALTSVMVCWLALLLLRRRFLPLKKLR